MTGRRGTRSSFRTNLPMSMGVLAVCAALTAGCGVIPGTSAGAEGGDITVMTWAPEGTDATNKPGMPAMAQAYARWINSTGGLNGRKLKVLTCNDHNDGVAAAKCARRAADEDVVAVVGSYSQFGDDFLGPLASAGIPYIGGYGVTNDEFTNPMSYPVNGGSPALLAGLGKELASVCGPVALIRPDTIAGDQLPQLLDSGLRAGGHAEARDQLAAENATEYATHTRLALERTAGKAGAAGTEAEREGCVVPALGDRTNTFMDSFRRDREDYPAVRTATVLGSVDQTVINATGGRTGPYEGSYITGWYPVAGDARWDGMKKVINEEAFDDNRIDPQDAGVQTTWIAYTVLKTVVESLGEGEVSSTTVRRALDDGVRVSTGGLTPALRWRFEDLLSVVGFPRLINARVTLQVVRGGRLVAARKGSVDTRKLLESATD
ncbi:ABC transporter substrate-binding protein [Streptomyces sp. WI04-05B]|uniref:ABC transporter substrate-binding protein n=1 Tax=Streptomyces TaxID=1883 RepID=UPI0029B6ACA4|nr:MULTISPECIES: ABC transporter substrate-binding protein [unclassified Streptomyces]MDX2545203.1 ABC transporter substrate-binding protein [Streptomyces sp. WI04-05B]MDX2587317.1 ABC transporter substrate-binding protein [Streptomyces sp. WI04-05A]